MRINIIDDLRGRLFHKSVSNAKPRSDVSDKLFDFAKQESEDTLKIFNNTISGYSSNTARKILNELGQNIIAREKRKAWIFRLLDICLNPLIILLAVIVIVGVFTGDFKTVVVIGSMIIISVSIRFYQENQAYNSAESLKKMVHTTCVVIRDNQKKEIKLEDIVPGDILSLSAGSIVPADARIIISKDLSVNQSLLTGESLPVEKHSTLNDKTKVNSVLDLQNICFMGSNIESGTATLIVVATGSNTYFGSIAKDIVGEREVTSFDKGISKFTWFMVTIMAILIPIVFVINGLTKHDWGGAFLFAVSVAVGLAPEMLPAIVAVNLTKGSTEMAKRKVIVKRLSSIQNLGAMNILCSDKTGTLTRNEVILVKNINVDGEDDIDVLHTAYINSVYQTGFKNLMDAAVIKHAAISELEGIKNENKKIDEIPFDFKRRRLSIITEKDIYQTLHCKGAVEEVLAICTKINESGNSRDIEKIDLEKIYNLEHELNLDGFQVIAVAKKEIKFTKKAYSVDDEKDLTFLGFMAFLDPPKESAADTIKELKESGVSVKVLTGDNEYVTKKVCIDVGLEDISILNGTEIEKMTDDELKIAVQKSNIFSKLLPEHKRRVILALQENDNVVGFLGDGINDAPALRTADVGISVNTATDIAKESADIILLDKSLEVLHDGVIEGRKVFGNINKYIKMGASSNFGNMFSVIGASALLPFLPMTPIQILTNNLLYDFSQTTIPTDNVDEEYVKTPRKWKINDIGKYVLCIGPISSLFDYITFGVMWFVFHTMNNPALFQTGWFIESLLTQTLIIHVIRSRKIPFIETNSSKPLLVSTFVVIALGIILTYSPIASSFGFTKLPLLYWPILFLMMVAYITLTQIIKTIYIRKFGYN